MKSKLHLEDTYNNADLDSISITKNSLRCDCDYGVIEHILLTILRSGIYYGAALIIDGSATHEKYDLGDFGSYLYFQVSIVVLKDVIREFLFHGMEIKEVIDARLVTNGRTCCSQLCCQNSPEENFFSALFLFILF